MALVIKGDGIYHCLTHGMTYSECCPVCGQGPKDSYRVPAGGYIGPLSNAQEKAPKQRPVLSAFADAMEDKLRKNDHKTGWRTLPVEALFKLLMVEIEEFKIAQEFFGNGEARNELVDIANFCMMLHDRLGMEEDKNSGVAK